MSGKANILKRANFLSLMSSPNKKRRDVLIDTASKNEIHALIESLYNISNGNVKLSPSELKRAKRYKNHIRKILNKKTKAISKKKLLKQTGGWIAAVIPLILGALGFSGAFGKIKK